MTLEVRGEQPFAIGARGGIVHGAESGALPRRCIAFDDESTAVWSVAVMMRDECSVLVLAKRERKTGENFGRAVPGELVRKPIDRRLEDCSMLAPCDGIDPVGADHQIAVGKRRQGIQCCAECDPHARFATFGAKNL